MGDVKYCPLSISSKTAKALRKVFQENKKLNSLTKKISILIFSLSYFERKLFGKDFLFSKLYNTNSPTRKSLKWNRAIQRLK